MFACEQTHSIVPEMDTTRSLLNDLKFLILEFDIKRTEGIQSLILCQLLHVLLGTREHSFRLLLVVTENHIL